MQVQETSVEVLPNRLRELRTARGMRLYDISHVIRVEPSTVSRWETGRSDIPSGRIPDLAELFEVTPEYLMAWDRAAA